MLQMERKNYLDEGCGRTKECSQGEPQERIGKKTDQNL